MNSKKLLILVGLFAALAIGCSGKKEEAAKLEKEMMQKESVAAESIADTSAMLTDTFGSGAPSVGAIPKEEQKVVPQLEEGKGYAVQVASCESLDYAQYLVEKYTARGYSPYLTTTTANGQTYYRVRIGGIESLQEAKKLKAELVDKYSIKAWIDKTE